MKKIRFMQDGGYTEVPLDTDSETGVEILEVPNYNPKLKRIILNGSMYDIPVDSLFVKDYLNSGRFYTDLSSENVTPADKILVASLMGGQYLNDSDWIPDTWENSDGTTTTIWRPSYVYTNKSVEDIMKNRGFHIGISNERDPSGKPIYQIGAYRKNQFIGFNVVPNETTNSDGTPGLYTLIEEYVNRENNKLQYDRSTPPEDLLIAINRDNAMTPRFLDNGINPANPYTWEELIKRWAESETNNENKEMYLEGMGPRKLRLERNPYTHEFRLSFEGNDGERLYMSLKNNEWLNNAASSIYGLISEKNSKIYQEKQLVNSLSPQDKAAYYYNKYKEEGNELMARLYYRDLLRIISNDPNSSTVEQAIANAKLFVSNNRKTIDKAVNGTITAGIVIGGILSMFAGPEATAAYISALGTGIAGGTAVDAATAALTDYNGFGDMIRKLAFDAGIDLPESVAEILNPGYWVGGKVGHNLGKNGYARFKLGKKEYNALMDTGKFLLKLAELYPEKIPQINEALSEINNIFNANRLLGRFKLYEYEVPRGKKVTTESGLNVIEYENHVDFLDMPDELAASHEHPINPSESFVGNPAAEPAKKTWTSPTSKSTDLRSYRIAPEETRTAVEAATKYYKKKIEVPTADLNNFYKLYDFLKEAKERGLDVMDENGIIEFNDLINDVVENSDGYKTYLNEKNIADLKAGKTSELSAGPTPTEQPTEPPITSEPPVESSVTPEPTPTEPVTPEPTPNTRSPLYQLLVDRGIDPELAAKIDAWKQAPREDNNALSALIEHFDNTVEPTLENANKFLEQTGIELTGGDGMFVKDVKFNDPPVNPKPAPGPEPTPEPTPEPNDIPEGFSELNANEVQSIPLKMLGKDGIVTISTDGQGNIKVTFPGQNSSAQPLPEGARIYNRGDEYLYIDKDGNIYNYDRAPQAKVKEEALFWRLFPKYMRNVQSKANRIIKGTKGSLGYNKYASELEAIEALEAIQEKLSKVINENNYGDPKWGSKRYAKMFDRIINKGIEIKPGEKTKVRNGRKYTEHYWYIDKVEVPKLRHVLSYVIPTVLTVGGTTWYQLTKENEIPLNSGETASANNVKEAVDSMNVYNPNTLPSDSTEVNSPSSIINEDEELDLNDWRNVDNAVRYKGNEVDVAIDRGDIATLLNKWEVTKAYINDVSPNNSIKIPTIIGNPPRNSNDPYQFLYTITNADGVPDPSLYRAYLKDIPTDRKDKDGNIITESVLILRSAANVNLNDWVINGSLTDQKNFVGIGLTPKEAQDIYARYVEAANGKSSSNFTQKTESEQTTTNASKQPAVQTGSTTSKETPTGTDTQPPKPPKIIVKNVDLI